MPEFDPLMVGEPGAHTIKVRAPRKPNSSAEADAPERKPLQWADTSTWDAEPCPRREWAVMERIPLRQVTLFSGEGAIGKSIVELMLGVAHVMAKDWLGSLPEPGGAFYFGCEDDEDELRIRLTAIGEHYGTTFDELKPKGFRFKSLAGDEAVLGAPDGAASSSRQHSTINCTRRLAISNPSTSALIRAPMCSPVTKLTEARSGNSSAYCGAWRSFPMDRLSSSVIQA